MASTLRQRLRPLYRNHWMPLLGAVLTIALRVCIYLARMFGFVKPAERSDQESFLIVSLAGHLGDTVMLLPGLEALRSAHPGARIEVAIETAAAPLLGHIDIIDKVHAFSLGATPPITFKLSAVRIGRLLRSWWPRRMELKPTIVLVPRWGDDLFGSVTFAYLTQAPRRIGFASHVAPRRIAAPFRDALLTDLIYGASGMHEPAKFIHLLSSSGLIPPVHDFAPLSRGTVAALIRAARQPVWHELADRLALPPPPFAVVAPGASMARRIYPPESWLPVIQSLHSRGFPVVLLAGHADAHIARLVHGLSPDRTTLVAGSTTLAETAAVLIHAAIFLGNDSGPGHLAGALGIPSIILFAAAPGCSPDDPAAPERVRPIGPRVTCLQPQASLAPCVGACSSDWAHCIITVEPEVVIGAVDEVLKRPTIAPS